MIAVDTNILVYSHRSDSPFHAKAKEKMVALAEGGFPWTILWPCLLEFLAIVTHPKVYNPPTSLDLALKQVDCWLESPTFILLTETSDYWAVLKKNLLQGKISGPRVHDAKIAALCLTHNIDLLWSADRDFSRFPDLKTSNPLA